MPQELLNRPQVRTVVQHVSGEGVAQLMRSQIERQIRSRQMLFEELLDLARLHALQIAMTDDPIFEASSKVEARNKLLQTLRRNWTQGTEPFLAPLTETLAPHLALDRCHHALRRRAHSRAALHHRLALESDYRESFELRDRTILPK